MVRCRREEVAGALPAADLAVPLAARLDASVLAGASRLRLILQYGVGLEGVDVPAVRAALAFCLGEQSCAVCDFVDGRALVLPELATHGLARCGVSGFAAW